jgi:hypothetical protein
VSLVTATTSAALALDAIQREVLLEELATMVVSLHDPAAREPYEDLAAVVDEGTVGEDLLGRLEGFLEMLLQTGRARRVHGAEAEQSLLFTVQGPGVYRLGISTDHCRLTLEIDRHGVTVESLEV